MKRYDVIIVGAGSAGCPLAARLSQDPSRSVLLLEAGPHFGPLHRFPRELQYGGIMTAMSPNHPQNWAFAATLTDRGLHHIVPRGKVVGGSSAINGTLFERGIPHDFDSWAAQGNHLWSFAHVLPFFKKLERDLTFRDDYHGDSGPIPVRHIPVAERAPVADALYHACRALGFPHDPDVNAPGSIGVGAVPVNNINGLRMNTAVTYLEPALHRPNLQLRAGVTVTRILFEGRRAVGVATHSREGTHVFHGNEIILSAGAVKSPHLLLLSGIGPADELSRFDIPLIHHSPGVGRDFTDHSSIKLRFSVKHPVRLDLTQSSGPQVTLHYTAEGSDIYSDMMLLGSSIPLNQQMLHNLSPVARAKLALATMRDMSLGAVWDQARHGGQYVLGVHMMQPRARGELSLQSADPLDKPRLAFRYLADPFDLHRYRHGLRLADSVLRTDPFRELGAKRISPTAAALDSDPALDDYIHTHLGTSIHMSGTCRMGPAGDNKAVVDQAGLVHGVSGLRLADTSIMPTVVRRCPHATAVMIGERIAALMTSSFS